MTGYTVHTGSSEKFSQGWDQIFGNPAPGDEGKSEGTDRQPKSKAARSPKKAAAGKSRGGSKPAAKKSAGKQPAAKKKTAGKAAGKGRKKSK